LHNISCTQAPPTYRSLGVRLEELDELELVQLEQQARVLSGRVELEAFSAKNPGLQDNKATAIGLHTCRTSGADA
jgi:hypothetical protein